MEKIKNNYELLEKFQETDLTGHMRRALNYPDVLIQLRFNFPPLFKFDFRTINIDSDPLVSKE